MASRRSSLPRRVLRRLRQVALYTGGAALALLLLGLGYETVSARGDADRFRPIGELVEVDGHLMHIHCRGEGAPVVVLEGGSGSTVYDWAFVQPGLATTTRTCVYDRAGVGWSTPGPSPRSPSQVAAELHALLAAAGEEPPFVLVGASLGGKYIRHYGHAFPDEVAGLVFLDARHEAFEEQSTDGYRRLERFGVQAMSRGLSTASRVGYIRAFGLPYVDEDLEPDIQAAVSYLTARPVAAKTMRQEYFDQGIDPLDREAETLGDKPVRVLAAGQGGMAMEGWDTAQAEMAALSSNSKLIVLEESGHAIALDAPEAVVDAVVEVVEEVRGD